jgi:uncharacterized membrane protein YeaQ/YmgE (transglycosylase-associated protein family)
MLGAVLLGLVAGVIARMLVPGDVFRTMSGPTSWLASIALGLAGAILGYLIFTVGLGIGDTDVFEWWGSSSAGGAPPGCSTAVAGDTSAAGLARSDSSWMLVRRSVVCEDRSRSGTVQAVRGGRRKPMKVRAVLRGVVVATILAVLGALLPQLASAAPEKASGRYLVRARSSADYAGLRAKAVKDGARVLRDLKQVNTMVVSAPASARSSLAADRRTLSVARSGVRRITADTGKPNLDAPGVRGAHQLKARAPAATTAAGINPDPAWDYKGLLWDYRRIGLPKGWKTSAGSSAVTVGVADTGLDFTHSELAPKVKAVVDFTGLEDPAAR